MKKGELWQENPIFCKGLNLSLEKAGQIQHPKPSNHISQVGLIEHDNATYQEESNHDYMSLLEQLELAMSENPKESSDDEVVNVEQMEEMALTSSGQSAYDSNPVRGTFTEARPASNGGTADFVIESANATSSSSTSQSEKISAGDETAWPSWTGM